ncbi:MAG: phosphotransferase [Alteromonadaceae bacterium]|nr:phosphotransferase [Alteromonadaceae bacterium]
MDNLRFQLLKRWLCDRFSVDSLELTPITGDAGFRCYSRFSIENETFIAVDAPGDKSNNQGFLAIQAAFLKKGLSVPKILAKDLQQGFFCLSDFGDQLFSDTLTSSTMNHQYKRAIDLLPLISSVQVDDSYDLPLYDRQFIITELEIFVDWLLAEHLAIQLNHQDKQSLTRCFDILVESAVQQPQVFMHRDYHSRNIMMLADGDLGIIDFQDAVSGPITYDIVSLLRDCYIRWPDAEIKSLFAYFCQLMTQCHHSEKQPFKTYDLQAFSELKWQQWFDLMGLQRHIKAAGIFARLNYRDNKNGYLKDIPLTLAYIRDISTLYPELSFLHELVKDKVLPALEKLRC